MSEANRGSIEDVRDRATGRVLRVMREHARISAARAARQMFTTKGVISSWERGDRTMTVGQYVEYCQLVLGQSPCGVLRIIEYQVQRTRMALVD